MGYLHTKARKGFPENRFRPSWFWPLRVGDIIHALRSSLDYLAWELARWNLAQLAKTRDPHGRTGFPLVTNADHWANVSATPLSDISKAHQGRIKEFQPYHAERPKEEPLAILSELSRRDKHRALNLVFVKGGAAFDGIEEKLQGWAFINSPHSDDAQIIDGDTGEVKSHHKMKATYQVEIEGFGRVDWILDRIGPKVAEVLTAFEPVFEDS